MTNSLAGAAQKFSNGVPTGTARDGTICFDKNTFNGYVFFGGVWNAFAVGGGGNTPANPTAIASDTPVNGVATTYMRSDAAPAVQKTTSSIFGLAKVDGTTIISTGGVISAVLSGIPPGDIVLTNGDILVGNASNVAAIVAMSGDATITNAGVVTVSKSGGVAFGSAAFSNNSAFDAAGAAAAAVAGIPLGSASVFGLVKVDGTTITASGGVISGAAAVTGANPTATAGPAAVNGVAATFMRSDAAPAIQKASAAQFGIVEVDGTTITAAAGVISAAAATSSTAGTVLIDNVSIKISGGKTQVSSNVFSHPGFQTGRFYTTQLVGGPTTAALTANILYAIPFFVPIKTTFTGASFNITGTSNGNHIETGVYNNNSGIPSTLLADFGSFTMTASAGFKTVVISQALDIGWYWLVLASDATPTLSTTNSNIISTYIGYNSGNLAASQNNLQAAWTFSAGALPGSFPAITYTQNTQNPLVFLGF